MAFFFSFTRNVLLLTMVLMLVVWESNGICTEEGLITSTEYWALAIKQRLYEQLAVLNDYPLLLQEKATKRQFCSLISPEDKKPLANGMGFYFYNNFSSANYLVNKEPGKVPTQVLVDPSNTNNTSPDSITEYCSLFHSTACKSSTPNDCPVYCLQPSLFNDSMLNFDLAILSSTEEEIKARLANKNSGDMFFVTTLRNVSYSQPLQPHPEKYATDLRPLYGPPTYTTGLFGLGPIGSPRKDFLWYPTPFQRFDVDNPENISNYISVLKPIYINNTYLGFSSIAFRLNWASDFLQRLKPTRSGFCLAAAVDGSIILSPEAAKPFFGVTTDLYGFKLSSYKNNTFKEVISKAATAQKASQMSDIDAALLSRPNASYVEISIDNQPYIVSFCPLQLAPITLICFASKNELLNSGSYIISTSSLAVELTQGDVVTRYIEMTNTGTIDLVHQVFVSPPPETPWLYMKDAGTAEHGDDSDVGMITVIGNSQINVKVAQGETKRLMIKIRSAYMTAGGVTSEGIVIDTQDADEGWCYSDQKSIKLQVQVNYRVDDVVSTSWDSAVGVVFAFFTTLLLVVNTGMLIGVVHQRQHIWIRTSSPLFCSFIIIGSMLGLSSVFFWIGEPNSLRCNGRVWFACVGFSLMFSTLLVKNLRVLWIFSSANKDPSSALRNNKPDSQQPALPVTEKKVLPFVLAIVFVELIFLILWTSINPLREEAVTGVSYLSHNQMSKKCTGDNLSLWLGLLIGYNGMLLLCGCVLAYKTRRINDSLNESKLIAICVYNIIATSAVIIPLLLFVTLSPDIELVLISLGTYSVFMIVILLLMGPRFYKIWKGEHFKLNNSPTTFSLPSPASIDTAR